MPRLPAVTPRARARKRARADANAAVRRAANAIAATVATPVAAAQVGGRAFKERAAERARAGAKATARASERARRRAERAAAPGGSSAGAAAAAGPGSAIAVRDWPAHRAQARELPRRRARRRFAFGTAVRIAAGYVFRARAGRAHYEQIRATARDVAGDPRVRQFTKQGGDTVRTAGQRLGKLADRAAGAAADGLRRRRDRSTGQGGATP
jgi:hypothetical protein